MTKEIDGIRWGISALVILYQGGYKDCPKKMDSLRINGKGNKPTHIQLEKCPLKRCVCVIHEREYVMYMKGSMKEPNKFHNYEAEKITRKASDAAEYIELFGSSTRDRPA